MHTRDGAPLPRNDFLASGSGSDCDEQTLDAVAIELLHRAHPQWATPIKVLVRTPAPARRPSLATRVAQQRFGGVVRRAVKATQSDASSGCFPRVLLSQHKGADHSGQSPTRSGTSALGSSTSSPARQAAAAAEPRLPLVYSGSASAVSDDGDEGEAQGDVSHRGEWEHSGEDSGGEGGHVSQPVVWPSPVHVRVRPDSHAGSRDDGAHSSGGGDGDGDGGGGGGGGGADSGSDFTGEGTRPLPFEFRVLEAALEAVCARLDADVVEVEAETGPALEALTKNVNKFTTEAVKRGRAHLTRVLARVADVRAELQRMLDDDSDMRDMHLTRKQLVREHSLRLWLGTRDGGGDGEHGDQGGLGLPGDTGRGRHPPASLQHHHTHRLHHAHHTASDAHGDTDAADSAAGMHRAYHASVHHHHTPGAGGQGAQLHHGRHASADAVATPDASGHTPGLLHQAETLLTYDDDIQDLEDLLETYFAQVDHYLNRLTVLRQVITDTEGFVEIDLDAKRNRILEMTVLLGFGTLSHGLASTAYGVFGMNFLLPAAASSTTSSDASGAPPAPPAPTAPSPIGNRFGRDKHGAFNTVTCTVMAGAFLLWALVTAGLMRAGMIHIIKAPRWAPFLKPRRE